MTTTTTTAEQIAAALGNDGLVFQTKDGRTLEELCEAAGCGYSKARARWDYEADEEVVEEVSLGEDLYDRVAYSFADGSAIVVAGDAWDIEGEEPFSWAGA